MAKILLVEDDNNLREIYAARLEAEGYEIIGAGDGEEALALAVKERPDLIISDVMMPKISGFDMLDILRSTKETKDTKVIMMTALSQKEDQERGKQLGANRYLVKSQVTLEDVVRVAAEVLAEDAPVRTVTPEPNIMAEPVTETPLPTEPVSVAPAQQSTSTEATRPAPTSTPAVTPPQAVPESTAQPTSVEATVDRPTPAPTPVATPPQTVVVMSPDAPAPTAPEPQVAQSTSAEATVDRPAPTPQPPQTVAEPTPIANEIAQAAAMEDKIAEAEKDPALSFAPTASQENTEVVQQIKEFEQHAEEAADSQPTETKAPKSDSEISSSIESTSVGKDGKKILEPISDPAQQDTDINELYRQELARENQSEPGKVIQPPGTDVMPKGEETQEKDDIFNPNDISL